MPVLITPESALGQELAKWNKPYVYQPFPKMVYMAQRRPDGIVSVCEASDMAFGGAVGAAEAFNRTCQLVVNSEAELAQALDRGWRPTPADAMVRHEQKEKAIAEAAANRAYTERLMSEAARAQAAAIDASTSDHVPEIPEAPKRRGRPPKNAV